MKSRLVIVFLLTAFLFCTLKSAWADNGACLTPTIPVYAPSGQAIEGFPQQLILDVNGTITASYSICYSGPPTGLLYVIEENSSQSISSLFDAYQKYLPLAGWNVIGTITDHFPQFEEISANNGWATVQVTVSAVGTGSQAIVGYSANVTPPPSKLSAVAGNGQVHLHWSPAQVPPDEYKVYIYQSIPAEPPILLDVQTFPGPVQVTSDTVSTISNGGPLINGLLYQFSVTAVGPQGESAPAMTYAQPGAFAAPAHPSNPILFLHGINADASAWQSTAAFLSGTLHWTCGGTLSYSTNDDPTSTSPRQNDPLRPTTCTPFQPGGDFYTVNFGDNLANYPDGRAIFHQGDEVGGFLRDLQSRGKFSVVAWSMGGLAARAYIEVSSSGAAPTQMSDLTTLGTPHLGLHRSFLLEPVIAESLSLTLGWAGIPNVLASQGMVAMDGGCVSNGDSSDYANQLSPFLYQIDEASALPISIRYTAISGTPFYGIRADECDTSLIWVGEPPEIQTDLAVPAPSSTFAGIIPTPQLWYAFNRDDWHSDLPNDVTAILCALDHSCAILNVFSPVDITVTAPNGQTISNTLTTMPGAEYTNVVDPTGHDTASVFMPFPQAGQYTITATPKAGALPTDTFTITLTQNGATTTIADAMQIQSIPPNGFQTQVKALPIANAGPNQTVQCQGHEGAWVLLDGRRSHDTNKLRLDYQWADAQGKIIGTSGVLKIRAPLGTTMYTLTVSDSTGLSSSAQTSVTVDDLKPPELWLNVFPQILIRADNQLVPISARTVARDHCGCQANIAISLISIVSNDPAEDADDIQGAAYGTDDRMFSLRARLTSTGDRRVYSITYRATDSAGNSSPAIATVTFLPRPVYAEVH